MKELREVILHYFSVTANPSMSVGARHEMQAELEVAFDNAEARLQRIEQTQTQQTTPKQSTKRTGPSKTDKSKS